MKKILIEDFSRPKYRDRSIEFAYPLPKHTYSGDDSLDVIPAYRSVRLAVAYDASHPSSYFMIKLHGEVPLPSGSIRLYGWRAPGAYVTTQTTPQYSRIGGYDLLDAEPICLNQYGPDSVFAFSTSDTWLWIQLGCFYQSKSVGLFLSETALSNIIVPANAYQTVSPSDTYIEDNFGS
jgi:hypothetical protein